MDIVHRRGSASVADVLRELPDAPTDGALRTMLKILEGKGLLRRTTDGSRAIYSAARPKHETSRNVLQHVVRTFFDGSAGRAAVQLLDDTAPAELSDDDLARLSAFVDEARRKRRS